MPIAGFPSVQDILKRVKQLKVGGDGFKDITTTFGEKFKQFFNSSETGPNPARNADNIPMLQKFQIGSIDAIKNAILPTDPNNTSGTIPNGLQIAQKLLENTKTGNPLAMIAPLAGILGSDLNNLLQRFKKKQVLSDQIEQISDFNILQLIIDVIEKLEQSVQDEVLEKMVPSDILKISDAYYKNKPFVSSILPAIFVFKMNDAIRVVKQARNHL